MPIHSLSLFCIYCSRTVSYRYLVVSNQKYPLKWRGHEIELKFINENEYIQV
jgi:hypothetical protein